MKALHYVGDMAQTIQFLTAERDRLKAENEELRKALEGIEMTIHTYRLDGSGRHTDSCAPCKAQAALAKAKGAA